MGSSVLLECDFNGDGLNDLLTYGARGAGYVVYGSRSSMPDVYLTNQPISEGDTAHHLKGTNGFMITGANPSSVACGDINSDGVDDLLLGDQYAYSSSPEFESAQTGVVYVILGARNGFPSKLSVDDLQGWNGFKLQGFVIDGRLGHSLSSGGDINGDTVHDMVLGTFDVDTTTIGEEQLFVLFGKSGWSQNPVYNRNTVCCTEDRIRASGSSSGSQFKASYSLYEIFSSGALASPPVGAEYLRGFMIQGTPPGSWGWQGLDRTGYSLSSSGDLNNDGISDIVIGSYGATPGTKVRAGAIYVILGNASYPLLLTLEDIASPHGFKVTGADAWDLAGVQVDTSGDVNGDSVKDLVIGAPGVDSSSSNYQVGRAYIIFGSASISDADIDLGSLSLPSGVAIQGYETGSRVGGVLTSRSDVNNDGISDIVLGVPQASFNIENSVMGGAHIYYGRNSYGAFSSSVISVADLHGSNGVTISGFDNLDAAGSSVSTGDFSGSTTAEVVLGVPSHWLSAKNVGGALVLDLNSNAVAARTSPEQGPDTPRFDHLCNCPDGYAVDAHAICIVMEAKEVTETFFDEKWSQISTPITNLLETGDVAVACGTGQCSIASLQRSTWQRQDASLYVQVTAVFGGYDDANAALTRLNQWTLGGAANFQGVVRDSTEINLQVIGGSSLHVCNSSSASLPVGSGAVGFSIQGIGFNWQCMSTGCWEIDLIYTTGQRGAINTFFLPKMDYHVGAANENSHVSCTDSSWYDTLEHAQARCDLDPNCKWLHNAGCDGQTWRVCGSVSGMNGPNCTGGSCAMSSACTRLKGQMYSYPSAVAATFAPKNFPCGTEDYNSQIASWKYTGCCLTEFMDKYRPLAEFGDVLVRESYSAQCNPSQLEEGPFSGEVFAMPMASSDGQFQGLGYSDFVPAPMVAPGTYAAKLRIDETELRNKVGMVGAQTSVLNTKINTFVGMANFVPTNLKFLDSSFSQIFVTLEKGDYFAISTSGDVEATFIEYMSMRLHAVKDGENWLQYAVVTFTLGSAYKVAQDGVIPLNSVRIGKGTEMGTVDWQYACANSAGTAIWDDVETQQRYASSLVRECAPDPSFCTQQATIRDGFMSFNVPLGSDFYDSASDHVLGNKVFVEFVVSVEDRITQAPSKTVLRTELPIIAGGTIAWCGSFQASAELKEIATVDIVVGSAGTTAGMGALNMLRDIDSAALSKGVGVTEYAASSIESGLLTLIVKGDDDVFQSGDFATYSIEMENLLTVHVMESGGITSATVQSLVESGAAFEVEVDEFLQTGYLEPTAALLDVCTFTPSTPSALDPIPSPCVLRRDIQFNKCPVVVGYPCQSVEIDPQATSEASRFMKDILGSTEYSHALGQNYSQLLASQHSLNKRYKRGWWINPGHTWSSANTSSSKYQLSQNVMIAALLRLKGSYNGGTNSSRRLLLQTAKIPLDYRRGSLMSNILYTQERGQLRSIELMAEILGVSRSSISTWKHVVRLSTRQACLPQDELKAELAKCLNELWVTHNPGVLRVYANSIDVDLSGVICEGSRREEATEPPLGACDLADYTEATVSVETAVVMQADQNEISICPFVAHPAIADLQLLYSGGELQTDAKSAEACLNGDNSDGDQDADDTKAGGTDGLLSNPTTLAIVAGAAGGVLLGSVGGMAWYLNRTKNVKVINSQPDKPKDDNSQRPDRPKEEKKEEPRTWQQFGLKIVRGGFGGDWDHRGVYKPHKGFAPSHPSKHYTYDDNLSRTSGEDLNVESEEDLEPGQGGSGGSMLPRSNTSMALKAWD